MENIEEIRNAAERGDILKVEFYADGSGATFYIRHKDYGRGSTSAYSLDIKNAMKAVAGFRFIQHELKTCY